jgi:uncharacterized paraquat-inducible protein A
MIKNNIQVLFLYIYVFLYVLLFMYFLYFIIFCAGVIFPDSKLAALITLTLCDQLGCTQ